MAVTIYNLLIDVVGTELPAAVDVCQVLAIAATLAILAVPFVVVFTVIQIICGR